MKGKRSRGLCIGMRRGLRAPGAEGVLQIASAIGARNLAREEESAFTISREGIADRSIDYITRMCTLSVLLSS